MNFFLWGILPYVAVASLIGGTLWRYKYDQFGWTTRSTQLYESRLLRLGSPLFHFGLVFVIVGHFVGLVIPKSWTDWAGLSQHAYHLNAIIIGGAAGFCTLTGVAILVYRRRTTGPVFLATTRNDKAMYVALVSAIVLGIGATIAGSGLIGEEHNYRETVSVWFRSLFIFQPDVDAMAAAPWPFHIHVLVALLLFAAWPYTRLVHAFTAPLHYLFRPYIVYRTRDARPMPGSAKPARGWSPVGTRDRDR